MTGGSQDQDANGIIAQFQGQQQLTFIPAVPDVRDTNALVPIM